MLYHKLKCNLKFVKNISILIIDNILIFSDDNYYENDCWIRSTVISVI